MAFCKLFHSFSSTRVLEWLQSAIIWRGLIGSEGTSSSNFLSSFFLSTFCDWGNTSVDLITTGRSEKGHVERKSKPVLQNPGVWSAAAVTKPFFYQDIDLYCYLEIARLCLERWIGTSGGLQVEVKKNRWTSIESLFGFPQGRSQGNLFLFCSLQPTVAFSMRQDERHVEKMPEDGEARWNARSFISPRSISKATKGRNSVLLIFLNQTTWSYCTWYAQRTFLMRWWNVWVSRGKEKQSSLFYHLSTLRGAWSPSSEVEKDFIV